MKFSLPEEVRHLVHARNMLRDRYAEFQLRFTPDGNMVGDLGEAIAAELFNIQLNGTAGMQAIDGKASDGRTVQVKATGRGHAAIFTYSEAHADHLIVLVLNYQEETVEVVFNGPYEIAMSEFDGPWVGQRSKAISKLRRWNEDVSDKLRLQPTVAPID